MIDKDKLIQFFEEHQIEISREQLDSIVDGASQFCGSFPKPYEVRIDFAPIVIEMMAYYSELKRKVQELELGLKFLQEKFGLTEQEMDRSLSDCGEL